MKRGTYLVIREWRGFGRRPMDRVGPPQPQASSDVKAVVASPQPQAGADAKAVQVQEGAATRLWRKYGRGAAGALILALLAPLTLLSESRLKEAIDALFNGCMFVVDVRAGKTPDRVEVLGYMSGKTPDYVNLTFRVGEGKINELTFTNGVLVRPATDFSSLVLHPMAGQTCPGKLCEAPQVILKPTEQMTIRLPYPSSNFDYLFTAQLSGPINNPAAAERLSVFSIADATKAETCRVEGPNLFNMLVRLDKPQRFLAYCVILLIGTILVVIFKRWGDKT